MLKLDIILKKFQFNSNWDLTMFEKLHHVSVCHDYYKTNVKKPTSSINMVRALVVHHTIPVQTTTMHTTTHIHRCHGAAEHQ